MLETKKDIWREMFPHKNFNDSNMENYLNELKTQLENYLIYEHLLLNNANVLMSEMEKGKIRDKREQKFKVKRYELLADIYEYLDKLELYEELLPQFEASVDTRLSDDWYHFLQIKMNFALAVKGQRDPFSESVKEMYYESFFNYSFSETLFVIINGYINGGAQYIPTNIEIFVSFIRDNNKDKKNKVINIYLKMYEMVATQNGDLATYEALLADLSEAIISFQVWRLSDIAKSLLNWVNYLHGVHIQKIGTKREERKDVIYIQLHVLIVNFILEHDLYYISKKIPLISLGIMVRSIWRHKGLGMKDMSSFSKMKAIFEKYEASNAEETQNAAFLVLKLMYFWAENKLLELEIGIEKSVNAFKKNKQINELPIFDFIRIKSDYLHKDFSNNGVMAKVEKRLGKIEDIIKDGKSSLVATLFHYELSIWRFILAAHQQKIDLNDKNDKAVYDNFLAELHISSPTFYYDKEWYYKVLMDLPKKLGF